MKIAFGRHSKGDRISCKRYRKSCNAYSDRQNAHPSAGRRGPFSSRKHRIFTGFNQRPASSPRFRYISSKPAAPCLRYFRARGWAVHSAPLLEVNKCEEADCTLCPGQRCARPMGGVATNMHRHERKKAYAQSCFLTYFQEKLGHIAHFLRNFLC